MITCSACAAVVILLPAVHVTNYAGGDILNHESLHVRAPHIGDGVGLARSWLDAAHYYTQLAPNLFQVPQEQGLAAWLEDGLLNAPTEELILVAEYAGQAVGFIHALIQPPLANAARQFVRDVAYPRLSIQALVVQQAYWRHGIGTKVLSSAAIKLIALLAPLRGRIERVRKSSQSP